MARVICDGTHLTSPGVPEFVENAVLPLAPSNVRRWRTVTTSAGTCQRRELFGRSGLGGGPVEVAEEGEGSGDLLW
jgi:hypothetical protein